MKKYEEVGLDNFAMHFWDHSELFARKGHSELSGAEGLNHHTDGQRAALFRAMEKGDDFSVPSKFVAVFGVLAR